LAPEIKAESESGTTQKRGGFKKWVLEIWHEKDLLIQKVTKEVAKE
jgi:hypothetical protein